MSNPFPADGPLWRRPVRQKSAGEEAVDVMAGRLREMYVVITAGYGIRDVTEAMLNTVPTDVLARLVIERRLAESRQA